LIDKQELEQILHFVAKRWIDITRNSDNKAMKSLPNDFWMNSVGGPAGKGRWVTTLLYTENEGDAEAFKQVLMRWQQKGMQEISSPDLIQIKKNEIEEVK